MTRRAAVDYARLFESTPTPHLVLTPDLVIVAANPAYLKATGRRAEDLIGRDLFDAFPENPEDGTSDGLRQIRASLERVRDTGEPETMAIQKYDIPAADGEGFVERYWSPVNVPVLDDAGQVALLLNRVEDVTEFFRAEHGPSVAVQPSPGKEHATSEVFARTRELADINRELRDTAERERLSAERLAGLTQAVLTMAGTQRVEELSDAVMDSGLKAMGADGGAVAVRDSEQALIRLTLTDSLGPNAQREYGELPLDGPLPASVAASTGELVLLEDRAAGLAWSPEMAAVHTATGKVAWAAVPLKAGGRLLGSLTVGWDEPRKFLPTDVRLLTAFAAQCAQALDRIQRQDAERQSAQAVRKLSEALQRSLLTAPPQPDHLQLAVRYQPAAEDAQVGGDWYDAFINADGATMLVIGDVTGHDREAAAAMAQVRNVLRGIAYAVGDPPGAVLASLDHALRGLAVETPTTAILAIIEQSPSDADQGVRTLRWANAGHPPPLLIHPDGRAELLSREPELLLAVDPATTRTDHQTTLYPGSTVVLYTDGLVERRDRRSTTPSSGCGRSPASSPACRSSNCATRSCPGWPRPSPTTTSRSSRCERIRRTGRGRRKPARRHCRAGFPRWEAWPTRRLLHPDRAIRHRCSIIHREPPPGGCATEETPTHTGSRSGGR